LNIFIKKIKQKEDQFDRLFYSSVNEWVMHFAVPRLPICTAVKVLLSMRNGGSFFNKW